MEAAPDLIAAFAAVRAVETRFLTASDDELLADMDTVESIGRVVDGMRIAAAAQVEFRSRKILGSNSLAFTSGARDGVELVQQTARVTRLVATRRVGLGSALAPATSLLGEGLPGRYPVLADAIAAGEVGVESARVILDTVNSIRKRVTPTDIETLVQALTDTAKVHDTEFLHETAQTWVAFLDPDGAEPRERAQRRTRALRFGRTLADGTTTMTMALIPEHLMMIKEILQSRRRGIHLVRTTPGGDDTCDELDPEWREETGPHGGQPRTGTQHDYDSLIDILDAGMKAQHDGTASTAVTHETVITITADEIEQRTGQGFAPGILAGLPIPVIERRACTDDTRLLVTGPKGEVLYLSHAHRLFTAAQKKALIVVAGGRCQYPDCRVHAPFLEAHHAQWWGRDNGKTDTDNGIMLCNYHHHLIHAPNTPVIIRKHDGDLYSVPTQWIGAPTEHQRRQYGPAKDPRLRDTPKNPWAA